MGVTDLDMNRQATFSAHYSVPTYNSIRDLLEDERVEMVLNLTNPGSHYEVSRQCLEAGRHVYSEKPLALSMPRPPTSWIGTRA